MNILYLSYDGLTDPLGRSQILPYLVGLSQHGFHFAVISFEKKNAMAQEGAIVSELCKAAGIEWYPCRYHKSPQVLSTMSDLWVMHRKAKKLMKNTGFRIIHARSYPAALVASRLSLSTGIPWLFDMRGFWADERKESGLWPQQNPLYAAIYRFFKRKEQWFFQQAAHTVSLTELAREEIYSTQGLVRNDRVSVIPCCADFQLFDPKRFSHAELLQLRQREGIPIDAFLLVYLGSLGTWYRLPEMMSFFSLLLKKKENARFLFLSGTTPEFIKQAAEKKGIDTDKLVIKKVQRASVPIYLSIADLGICFLQQTFSKIASSPVKLGEMLAMGLPVVCNDAGDCAQMIKHGENGLLLPDLKNSTIESAVDEVLRSSFAESEAIRAGAFGKLSLEKGIDAYSAVYDKILSR